MDNLNVKNINDEKIFSVIDPQGQGEVQDRIRPISISINQDVKTVSDETESKVTISVYWNDTWKEILNLTFNDSLRKEYGKLVEDLTAIQKDVDMKQYKDAETKTNDMLKYLANISNKYTQMSTKVDNIKSSVNPFVTVTAEKDHFSVKVSERLLNFLLSKFEKVATLDYRKSNENFCINASKYNEDTIDLYYHSPALFETQGYMTVVKNFKTIGSYKATYDQFSKLASKLSFTPEKMGYKKDRFVGYTKTAEVVMQNIFFDTVDEAKEWQEMVDEKKKEEVATEETNQEETTEKPTVSELPNDVQKGNSPAREDGGLARPDESFAGADELPENEPQQQQQMGQGMAASRRINNVKKKAKRFNIKIDDMDITVNDTTDKFTEEEIKQQIIKKNPTIYWSDDRAEHWFFDFPFEVDGDRYWISSEKIANDLNSMTVRVEEDAFNKGANKNKKSLKKKAEEKLYKYEELSEDAKDKVRSYFSNNDHSWFYEDQFPEEQEYILKEKYAQYNVERDNLDIEWDNYNRCTVNLKDKFAYWPAFKTIWVDCAKQVLKDLPMFAKDSELLEDWATEAASDMYFQHDHFEVYSGLNDIDDQDGMELSYQISDLCTKAYEEKVEPILSDIASDFEDILQKQEDYFYSEQYVEDECAGREILFDEEGNIVKEGKKRNGLRRKANLNKKAKFVVKDVETGLFLKNDKTVEDTKDATIYNTREEAENAIDEIMYKVINKMKEYHPTLEPVNSEDYYEVIEINASTNKKALYGDVQEADIVPAKTETKVYLQSEEKKTATDYKGEVAELLDEINEPDVLVDYISEDDAKKICKELNIPHEAEWYKGDLRGYIAEIPDGMVDVLIEYISESDAEHIWRQIQRDMGNDIDSSKKINVKKQAEELDVDGEQEEDTIAIGDIVTVDTDTLADKDEFAKYEVFAGEPAILMEVDKDNIDNVVIEKVEYPYERTTIEKEKIDIYDDVAGEEIILEDADGDEMVATLSAIPEIAASTKIKSVKKVATLSKKAGYVKIDTEDYLNLLSDRAKEIGRQIPMEEEFFNYIRDFGEDTDFGSPSYVVDNYCINGEFVERETGFTADGDYSNKFKEYNGDWNEFCSNEAVFYNEEEACLNLGL